MNERAATLYVEIVERECASEKHIITTQARQRDSAHKIYVRETGFSTMLNTQMSDCKISISLNCIKAITAAKNSTNLSSKITHVKVYLHSSNRKQN